MKFFGFGACLAFLAVVASSEAIAQVEVEFRPHSSSWSDERGRDTARPYRRYRQRYAQYNQRRPRHQAARYSASDYGRSDTPRCYGIVTAVGVESLSAERALAAAERVWAASVRFDYGERYLDLDNAEQRNSVCTRSSVNDSFGGKLGEQIVGESAISHRCKIWARPCRAPVTPSEVAHRAERFDAKEKAEEKPKSWLQRFRRKSN
jgi:hypothetical protein